jgi:hypothetical protein
MAKDLPPFTKEQIEALEASFPPRCYNPSRESVEEHLKYAGRVELIATLRASYEMEKQRSGLLHLISSPQAWEENS